MFFSPTTELVTKKNVTSGANFIPNSTKMKRTLMTLCTCITSFCALYAQNLTPVVNYYNGVARTSQLKLAPQDGATVTDPSGAEWRLSIEQSRPKDAPDATDYNLTWTLVSGTADQVSVGVEFPFGDWTPENYVFVPAAVYDGNRFDVKDVGYPPFWYDTAEWRLDMPTTTTVQPTLGKASAVGTPTRIELNTGNASTPLMAFHSPDSKRGWMVLTTQGSRFGDHGMTISESADKTAATFAVTAPAVRSRRAAGAGFAASDDSPANFKAGESVSISLRVYSFKSNTLQDMMNRFSEARKDLNPSQRRESLPFSEAWKLIENLYQTERWDDNIDLYCLSKPGTGTSWNFIWQLGWCGGGQCTLPLMMQGSELARERAKRNLEVIFSKSQAESGFYNAYGNGKEFAGFGYFEPLANNITFVRSQGDWLYMAQRQIDLIESTGGTVPTQWRDGMHKLADAFLRNWEKYGQFGQFIDVKSGDVRIGGSTSGAIVPAGLALASLRYDNPKYLDAARGAARKFHKDFVLKGYTTGGPGEILSTPDSESAFGLFESFVVLYEVTGEKEWLTYAADLLPICQSWAVSYDYRFPAESQMGLIDARSCGSVWASVANKHSAPGFCTWSGDSFLKYFRATGDERALEYITDVAHGLPQYMSRADQPIGGMPAGGLCERVNLSDWEGRGGVGGNIFGSCSWVEASAAMTTAMLPGIYVQPDKGVYAVLDNIKAENISTRKGELTLRLSNPTKFHANVKVLSESSKEALKPRTSLVASDMTIISLAPGESKDVKF